MNALLAQRCLHHPGREAVARCPECAQFYCRECVTEHEDRVICSTCLKRLSVRSETRRAKLIPLLRGAAVVGGLLFAWLFFFLTGRVLVSTPSSFHEGAVWSKLLPGAEGEEE